MYNGKITVRLLSQLKMIPEGQCIMPQSLYDYGWLSCLPIVNIIALPQISKCIALEFSKDQIIEYLISNNDRELFGKFHEFDPNLKLIGDLNEFNLYFLREQSVRTRLMSNGFLYPENMQDVVQLFIELGFLIVDMDDLNKNKLDLIVNPFPKPENVLKIL